MNCTLTYGRRRAPIPLELDFMERISSKYSPERRAGLRTVISVPGSHGAI
jgi:hypothetical protein